MSNLELEGWQKTAKLERLRRKLDKLQDLPYSTLQFKNGGNMWQKDIRQFTAQLNSGLGIHSGRVVNEKNVKKSWARLRRGK